MAALTSFASANDVVFHAGGCINLAQDFDREFECRLSGGLARQGVSFEILDQTGKKVCNGGDYARNNLV